MDRRGFGASSDNPTYSLDRELADVAAVVGGDLETAIVMVLRDLLEFTEEQIEERRAESGWAGRVPTAPTVAREAWAEQEWTYAGSRMDRVTAPTMLSSGTESPPDIKQATAAARTAVPGARVRTMPGHAHISHRTDPAMVAGIIRELVRELVRE